ncbi:hypothetical protein CGH19_15505 [Vibrio parahaemolyticus]|nr:hypothetical protein CGH19_15505 [Vibrio parahaemolyticus]
MRQEEELDSQFQDVAKEYPNAGSKLGIALSTVNQTPINGMRVEPENGTNGWYIWCGEDLSTNADFFEPLHVEHIVKYLPQVQAYLGLPPGYRFLIDNNGYEDIRYDSSLLEENA